MYVKNPNRDKSRSNHVVMFDDEPVRVLKPLKKVPEDEKEELLAAKEDARPHMR
jgi:hypothetical protein